MLLRRPVLFLAVVPLLAAPDRAAAQSFCNTGAFHACISVLISTNTSADGLLSVGLDGTAPVGLTVNQVVIRALVPGGFFGGASTYAFNGAFAGVFSLGASFQLISEQQAVQAELAAARNQEETISASINVLLGQIEDQQDELTRLQSQLETCQAAGDAACVANLLEAIAGVTAQLQNLSELHTIRLQQRSGILGNIATLENRLQELGDDPRFAQLLASDVTVDSWTGGMAPVSAVPEPATITMLGTGLAALAGWSRRRKRS